MVAARSSLSISCCSWPKPLTTRTPVTADSTTPASAPVFCCESQVAGNSRFLATTFTASSPGPTARPTSVSSGERKSIAVIEAKNIRIVPASIGAMPISCETMLMSEEERATICPVSRLSWPRPSSRESESKTSVRRSFCTSMPIEPPR